MHLQLQKSRALMQSKQEESVTDTEAVIKEVSEVKMEG